MHTAIAFIADTEVEVHFTRENSKVTVHKILTTADQRPLSLADPWASNGKAYIRTALERMLH